MKKSIRLIFALFIGLSFAAYSKSFTTERWQTANGTPVILYQAMEVPMLDIQLAFAAGSAYEGNRFGLSALTTALMDQGNAGISATILAEQLADKGAQFDAQTSRDMMVFSLKTLTRKDALEQATKTFTTIISRPDFPEAAVIREKNQQLTAIKQAMQSPDTVANLAFFHALYKQHPYAHPIIGTEETVAHLKKEDVKNFYQQYVVAKNAVLVMVGAIDRKQAEQLAEQITGPLTKGRLPDSIPEADRLKEDKQQTIQYPSSQTMIRLGQLGIDHHHPDYFPLIVGNYILGGGSLVSRLALEVREKRGLTYGVYSQFLPMPGKGPFLISLSTKNNQTKEAIKVTRDTLQNFLKKGATKDELTAAKQYLTGSFPLSLASNSSIATMLLKIAFYHLPDNYLDTYVQNIEAVKLSDIQRAFQTVIQPEKWLLVTVGQM